MALPSTTPDPRLPALYPPVVPELVGFAQRETLRRPLTHDIAIAMGHVLLLVLLMVRFLAFLESLDRAFPV